MANSNVFFKGIVFFAIILTTISFFFVYQSFSSLITKISGYASSVGEANVTVETIASLNFTTAHINWGSGRVNSGYSSANLNTFATNNVTNGNWTLQTGGGLRIENTGNVNLSLNLSATKTAAQMIGGTSPAYRWNISNVESGSCRNSTGGTTIANLDNWYNPNTTTTEFCRFFHFSDSQDTVRIDFDLTIPADSFTGALGDTITATAFPAAY